MQASREERDDLTKITGIGAARQSWLAAVFGVRTYGDLAALSGDDIEAQLKAEGKPYSRSEIELWPQEAVELAAEKAESSIDTTAEPSVSEVGEPPANETPQQEAVAPHAQGEQWKPVATFIVEFQTRQTKDQAIEQRTKVNYHDTDQEVVWPGIESEPISQWIIEQACEKLHPEIREAPTAKPEAEPVTKEALPGRLSVAITDLRLYQPAGMEATLVRGEDGRPDLGVVDGGSPFRVEVDFELEGQATAVIGRREIPYRVQFHAHDRHTGDRVHLGDAEPGMLVSDRVSYSALLGGVKLPASTYRLQVVVIAESEKVVPGYLELPMLRVVRSHRNIYQSNVHHATDRESSSSPLQREFAGRVPRSAPREARPTPP
jgi:hypothetical protein